jgi:hypothetical protein
MVQREPRGIRQPVSVLAKYQMTLRGESITHSHGKPTSSIRCSYINHPLRFEIRQAIVPTYVLSKLPDIGPT